MGIMYTKVRTIMSSTYTSSIIVSKSYSQTLSNTPIDKDIVTREEVFTWIWVNNSTMQTISSNIRSMRVHLVPRLFMKTIIMSVCWEEEFHVDEI